MKKNSNNKKNRQKATPMGRQSMDDDERQVSLRPPSRPSATTVSAPTTTKNAVEGEMPWKTPREDQDQQNIMNITNNKKSIHKVEKSHKKGHATLRPSHLTIIDIESDDVDYDSATQQPPISSRPNPGAYAINTGDAQQRLHDSADSSRTSSSQQVDSIVGNRHSGDGEPLLEAHVVAPTTLMDEEIAAELERNREENRRTQERLDNLQRYIATVPEAQIMSSDDNNHDQEEDEEENPTDKSLGTTRNKSSSLLGKRRWLLWSALVLLFLVVIGIVVGVILSGNSDSPSSNSSSSNGGSSGDTSKKDDDNNDATPTVTTSQPIVVETSAPTFAPTVTILNGRLAALESCSVQNDCFSRACGYKDVETFEQVCCRLGARRYYVPVAWQQSGKAYVCGRLQSGEACATNDMCDSSICINGICQSQRLTDFDPCVQHNDCQSRLCAYQDTSTRTRVCCSEGASKTHWSAVTWSSSSTYVCGALPAGASCTTNDMCYSNYCIGGVCAEERLPDLETCTSNSDCLSGTCAYRDIEQRDRICCNQGSTTHWLDVAWSTSKTYVCGDRPLGTPCSTDAMCSSNLCIDGICSMDRLDSMESCKSNNNCKSRICAYMDTSTRELVCCGMGADRYWSSVTWSTSKAYVCGFLAPGDTCTIDDMCEDNLCIDGVCTQERLADLEPCDTDNDCQSKNCAYQSTSIQGGGMSCCPEGDIKVWTDVEWSSSRFYVCQTVALGDTPAGKLCDEDNKCSKGHCILGTCSEERREDWEFCGKDGDCDGRACAREESLSSAPLVCCSNGTKYYEDVSWSSSEYYICGNLPDGAKCDSDRVCDSHICNFGTCSSKRLDALSVCGENDDCSSGACAREESLSSAVQVCCEGGVEYLEDVSWSSSDYSICGMLQEGKRCDSDRVCKSGICNIGVCASARLDDLEFCNENDDCLNGSCGRSESLSSAPKICCKYGLKYVEDVSWSSSDYTICGELPVDAKCDSNRVCESGICVLGTCVANQLADLEFCDDRLDCTNYACARQESLSSAPNVCCKNGVQFTEDVKWSSTNYNICGNLPEGSACDSDRVCESNVCVFGRCASSRLDDLQECENNLDCLNVACGLSEAASGAPKVCCVDGFDYFEDVSWSSYKQYICGKLVESSKCSSDRVCRSGNCTSGVCV